MLLGRTAPSQQQRRRDQIVGRVGGTQPISPATAASTATKPPEKSKRNFRLRQIPLPKSRPTKPTVQPTVCKVLAPRSGSGSAGLVERTHLMLRHFDTDRFRYTFVWRCGRRPCGECVCTRQDQRFTPIGGSGSWRCGQRWQESASQKIGKPRVARLRMTAIFSGLPAGSAVGWSVCSASDNMPKVFQTLLVRSSNVGQAQRRCLSPELSRCQRN